MTVVPIRLAEIHADDLPESWPELVALGKQILRQRKITDLNFARVCRKMLDGPGSKSQRDVAEALGCSHVTVGNAVRALDSMITPGNTVTSDDLEDAYDEAMQTVRSPRPVPAPTPPPAPAPPREEAPTMQVPLDGYNARRITNDIKTEPQDATALIAEAFHRRADAALSYQSWDRYCHAELGGVSLFSDRNARRRVVRELSGAGLPNRAIGHALSMDEKTVRGDLKALGVQPEPEVCEPLVITGTVKTSPLHYARETGRMLAAIDAEHYGPDNLTAEQLRLLGVLRDALTEFSAGWEREEQESIRTSEGEAS